MLVQKICNILCICIFFFDINIFKLCFYYILYNLSFLITTLKKFLRATTIYQRTIPTTWYIQHIFILRWHLLDIKSPFFFFFFGLWLGVTKQQVHVSKASSWPSKPDNMNKVEANASNSFSHLCMKLKLPQWPNLNVNYCWVQPPKSAAGAEPSWDEHAESAHHIVFCARKAGG